MSRALDTATVLLLALTLAGCSAAEPARPATTADMAAINTTRSSFVTTMSAGDAAALTALYSSDAVLMVENAPAINGKDAILAHYQGLFTQNTAQLTLTSEETQIARDWGFDRGQFTFVLTPKNADGVAVNEQGKYMIVVQKDTDGSWKVAREIGNSNAIATPPAVTPAAAEGATQTK